MKYLLYAFIWFYVLWILYLGVMQLKRARDNGTLSKAALVMGYPLVIIGYLLDILFNWVIGTILFLELPKNGVFTSHLNRHYLKDTWRGKIATWICRELLNTFDPNPFGHCKKKLDRYKWKTKELINGNVWKL